MPAMRALLRDEAAAVVSRVPRRAGSYGLRLGMHEGIGACPDAVAHWVRLRRSQAGWSGDVRAHGAEPLPFADDTFSLVWLSQTLQFDHGDDGLLREAFRLTAPGGLVAISGMHPVSAWAPWMAWNLRDSGASMHLRAPSHVSRTLAQLGFEVGPLQRFGAFLPRPVRAVHPSSLLGGGYLVMARKRPDAITPLRLLRLTRASRAPASLAPGAHRECA